MPKRLAIPLVLLLLVVAAAQFVPVKRTNPPVEAAIPAPAPVGAVLRRACFDCHSNETAWPWYSRVAPASWLVARDVKEGRENLNFSFWGLLPAREKQNKAKAIVDQLGAGAMPLRTYLFLHPKARPAPEEVRILRDWFSSPEAAAGSRADSLASSGPWREDDELEDWNDR